MATVSLESRVLSTLVTASDCNETVPVRRRRFTLLSVRKRPILLKNSSEPLLNEIQRVSQPSTNRRASIVG